MKTPFNPTDPLLQILAEDAADLPLNAADEARKTRSLRLKRHRQIALTFTVIFCSTCAWQFFPRGKLGQEYVALPAPSDAPITNSEKSVQPLPHFPEPLEPLSPQPRQVAIVRTEEQAMNEPLPLPEGLTKEQEGVVKAARGLPLLLVRDTTGKIARIHVIER